MSVSSDDPRPPYVQVADHIRVLIERGELRPGQRIPSGRDLAKRYGVVLVTVQRAVDLLKDEGTLVSHPPRGVFVAQPVGDASVTTEPSPEYREIMRHLDELQAAFREHKDDVDRRLTALEERLQRPRRRT